VSTDVLRVNTEDVDAYTSSNTPLVVLTAEERQTLEQWARCPTTAGLGPTRAPRPGVRLDQDQRGDRGLQLRLGETACHAPRRSRRSSAPGETKLRTIHDIL